MENSWRCFSHPKDPVIHGTKWYEVTAFHPAQFRHMWLENTKYRMTMLGQKTWKCPKKNSRLRYARIIIVRNLKSKYVLVHECCHGLRVEHQLL